MSAILDLYKAVSPSVTLDDDQKAAVAVLQKICNAQGHSVPNAVADELDDEAREELETEAQPIFDAVNEIVSHWGDDSFTLDFDGNEYRLIQEDSIWEIYRDEIRTIVEDCYSDVLNLDQIPSFIAVSIDWEQTATNAYADGYGHTFSGYDGSEEYAAGYYIFRTN